MAGMQTTTPPGIDDSKSGDSTAAELGAKAQDAAGAAVGTIRQQGSELQHVAREKAVKAADERRVQLVQSARGFEGDIRSIADSVRERQPAVGDVIEQAADRTASVLEYVERTPVDQIVSDMGQRARQHPAVVAASMFGAGFLIARALRPVDSGQSTTMQDAARTSGRPHRYNGGRSSASLATPGGV